MGVWDVRKKKIAGKPVQDESQWRHEERFSAVAYPCSRSYWRLLLILAQKLFRIPGTSSPASGTSFALPLIRTNRRCVLGVPERVTGNLRGLAEYRGIRKIEMDRVSEGYGRKKQYMPVWGSGAKTRSRGKRLRSDEV